MLSLQNKRPSWDFIDTLYTKVSQKKWNFLFGPIFSRELKKDEGFTSKKQSQC